MCNIWNNAQLLPPPVYTFKARVDNTLGIKELSSTLKDIISVLSNQSILHKEAACLSRIIYKSINKYHCDIGYRSVRKTQSALLHYLKYNLENEVLSFSNTVPHEFEDAEIYLPTRQMLEYLLVKFQGFSKLMCRIVKCCETVAHFFYQKMHIGHLMEFSLLIISLHSKIWSICKELCIKACSWYDNLLKYLNILQINGAPWLPKGYIFPNNLKEWLDEDWLKTHQVTHKLKKIRKRNQQKTVFDLINLSDDEDVQFFAENDPECFIVEDDDNEDTSLMAESSNIEIPEIISDKSFSDKLNIDIGEIVSREIINNDSLTKETKSKNAVLTVRKVNEIGDSHNVELQENLSIIRTQKIKYQAETQIASTILKNRTTLSHEEFPEKQKKKKKKTKTSIEKVSCKKRAIDDNLTIKNNSNTGMQTDVTKNTINPLNVSSQEKSQTKKVKKNKAKKEVQVDSKVLINPATSSHNEEFQNEQKQKVTSEIKKSCLIGIDDIASTSPVKMDEVSRKRKAKEDILTNRNKNMKIATETDATTNTNYSPNVDFQENRQTSKDKKNKYQTKTNCTASRLNEPSPSPHNKDLFDVLIKKKKEKVPKAEKICHSIDTIKNGIDLDRFIKTEEMFRQSKDKKSLSQNLGIMQWHALKNVMQTYIQKLNNNNNTKHQVQIESTLKNARDLWNNKINFYKRFV